MNILIKFESSISNILAPTGLRTLATRFYPTFPMCSKESTYSELSIARHAVCRQQHRHPDCSRVDTPPSKRLFEKNFRMLPERLKKCADSRESTLKVEMCK
ncbi:hypothetical protein AVEN_132094-1 [Araneus ventricosus]|uniref:Uncharacterized protein n=1 Tax=Araneus ventricosus TaxID=182803 RepID=A0A4Y2F811_ARAVE|nr:hypothetical protein AVEN_132094-1 [Araneus ventricosus]